MLSPLNPTLLLAVILAAPLAAHPPLKNGAQAMSPATPASQGTLAATLVDDFETYSVPSGSADFVGSQTLDNTSIVNGQGPGLVATGCTYDAANGAEMFWYGTNYYGLTTQSIGSNSSAGLLILNYDTSVNDVSFDMDSFLGFPDTVVVTGYDDLGLLVFTSATITLPGASPMPFSYQGANVKEIHLTSSGSQPWSALLDNHAYASGPSLNYSITGLVGGSTATFTVSGATAGGSVLIGFSLTGSGPTNTPFGPVDMSAPITQLPTLTADGAGVASMSTSIPARATGFTVYTQAADLATVALTNSLAELVL